MEELYGKPGIDTPYEREKVEYHPNLNRPDNNQYYRIDPQVIQKIERSKDFTISSTLANYDQLIDNINAIMKIIEQRNQTDAFKTYLDHLASGKSKDVIKDEEAACGITGSGDTETYTVLYRMKASCEMRRSFLDSHYRVQFTDRTDIQEIEEAERQSIDAWLNLEHDFMGLSDALMSSFATDEESENTTEVAALEQTILKTEINKKTLSTLHTTMADTSYVHRNRTLMFAGILSKIQMIVQAPQVVMPSGMREFLLRISTLGDLAAAKAHLMLTFTDLRQTHQAAKGQFIMVDDNKEQFVSRQQWFHQQVQARSTHTMTTWLYNQNEGSPVFDSFASIMVGSIQNNQQKYDTSVTDMLKFYQQESIFCEKQFMLIQKKEQIRQFFRILEDFGDANTITTEWVDEYVSAHGYNA